MKNYIKGSDIRVVFLKKPKGGNKMTIRRVRAGSAKSARRKCKGKRTTVTKVNYIKGSKKGRMGTYSVTTKKKKK